MKQLTMQAPAKVNLILEIQGKRPDGYHELKTIMHTLELADTLRFRTRRRGIVISCDHPAVPIDERNLVHKAARLLMAAYTITQGVHIHIQKRIPVAAGMGGGSSDAAAALRGLSRLWNLGMPQELISLAKQLGSDVPFFLQGGCALGTGRGERVHPWPACPGLPVVVVNPGIAVSTAMVYKKISLGLTRKKACINMMRLAIKKKNTVKISQNLFNHLELVTEKMFPIITEIKRKLLELGAEGVLMSGSGSTVFGLMPSIPAGLKIKKALSGYYPLVALTRTSDHY